MERREGTLTHLPMRSTRIGSASATAWGNHCSSHSSESNGRSGLGLASGRGPRAGGICGWDSIKARRALGREEAGPAEGAASREGKGDGVQLGEGGSPLGRCKA